MDTKELIEQIKGSLTGDPLKDGPFLKTQAEKYTNEENSLEINRELAKLAYEVTKNDYDKQLNAFLDNENQMVNEQIENAKKRFDNRNYNGGIKILEEIIRNNLPAWNDTSECTYKSFGSPFEFLLYNNIYEPDKEIKPVNCNLAGVYWMYCHGLTQKERYDEALAAIERAESLNPVDPDVYLQYAELMKLRKNPDAIKDCCDKLLKCAVTKEQIGRAYFNYSYYFSEKHDYSTAAAMLELSRLFFESDMIDSEMSYISGCMGIGSVPQKHTSAELMQIMQNNQIQPGPSTAVIQTAYFLAKKSESALEFRNAKFYYEIVWELTEDDSISNTIQELSNTIKDIKEFK
jgi:tetratricopeptide (TPR) repeat protein